MKIELSQQQVEKQKSFREFVDGKIVPYADRFDKEQHIPVEVLKDIGAQGYLGALVPLEYGGSDMDMITYGIFCEEIGRGSSSLLSLFAVHGMMCQAILKWGSPEQRKKWLPKLSKGDIIGAFGLSEPKIGSDAGSVETRASLEGNVFVLNGRKKWISFGQVADLFLIIARCDDKPTAFLIEKGNPGFRTEPIQGMLGFQSAMLAELHMEDCRIPSENIVGRIGFGFTHVAGTALDYGRYCIACGCVGLGQACLEACIDYTNQRSQGGKYLKEHQLIQKMMSDMITHIKAARLLCYQAGYKKENADPESIMDTSIAKYFASTMANQIASDAVQIHGANGCSQDFRVQRYFRDAKIMEIIEGSNQIQQLIISKYAYQFI